MNFLKRAMTSVKRNIGKTSILFAMVFVIGNLISGAISVSQAVKNAELNLRKNMPAVASFEIDWEAADKYETEMGEYPDFENITPDTIREIGKLPQVSHYDFNNAVYVFGKDLEAYIPEKGVDSEQWDPGMFSEREDAIEFTLQGVEDPELYDIKEGLVQLKEGRIFTKEEMTSGVPVAVVSEKFAQANNLSIGQSFTVEQLVYDYARAGYMIDTSFYQDEENIAGKQTYDIEIIGLFEPLVDFSEKEDEWEEIQSEYAFHTKAYVPNTFTEGISFFQTEKMKVVDPEFAEEIGEDAELLWYDHIFTLNDPLELEIFKELAMEKLPAFYKMVDVSNTFADVSNAMETMQGLTTIVLYVSVGAGLLIVSLLITLFLRDRKHEIGIYAALGEKKGKIISQMLLEVVTVAAIGIVLSLFTGNLLSSSISENMLRSEMVAQKEEDMYGGGGEWNPIIEKGIGTTLSTDEMLESFNVSLDGQTVFIFFSVALGTVLIATVAPIIYIVRLNPKKIMM